MKPRYQIARIQAKPSMRHSISLHLPPWTKELREWQENATTECLNALQQGRRTFLLVATPGAGKTLAAARIAYGLLADGRAERLVVVVPTSHLRTQWAQALASVGIQVDPAWQNGDYGVSSDFCGVVVTYHQVAASPELHRMLTSRTRTMMIADEIHHAGDERSWGSALLQAYDHAVMRLLLSGTPFRSDNAQIPWVQYVPGADGTTLLSKADYTFGYADALLADQVRPVVFPAFEGEMVWLDGLDERRATFGDQLSDDEASKRLKTALDPHSNWLRDVLTQAHQRLVEIRANGHPDAGGLVLAINQKHAREIAHVLAKISGKEAVVATSDDPDASEKIKRFTKSVDPWLVAVRMVSEGVDIPRLRLAVYATNVISELFFRQAMGRIVRKIPHIDDQLAYLYIPDEENLRRFAERVKEERQHARAQEEAQLKREVAEQAQQERSGQQGLFVPISSEAYAQGVVYNGELIPPSELEFARTLMQGSSISTVMVAEVAMILRRQRQMFDIPAQEFAPPPPPRVSRDVTPAYGQRDRLRRHYREKVGQFVAASNGTLQHKDVHSMAIQLDGKTVKQASAQDLVRRLEWLDGLIEEVRHG